ncbi:MAG: STAS domain-containing protein, partial [Armatimonadota bacterium]
MNLDSLPLFRKSVEHAAAAGRHVIADLSQLESLHPAGVWMLEEVGTRCYLRGTWLVIAAPSPDVRRLMESMSAPLMVPILLSESDALDFVAQILPMHIHSDSPPETSLGCRAD